jgi:hypothetical protein
MEIAFEVTAGNARYVKLNVYELATPVMVRPLKVAVPVPAVRAWL